MGSSRSRAMRCPTGARHRVDVMSQPMADGKERWMKMLSTFGAEGCRRARDLVRDTKGQGTTEYAILVGVLVVIAILAIIAFRGKVQELWDAIVSGMNSL